MSGVAAQVVKDRAAASEGLGTCNNPIKYLDQDYEKLKAQCLASKTLFKDENFPAVPSVLGYRDLAPNSAKTQGIVWKRPSGICSEPHFIVDGASRFDICQRGVGDCWFLAAIASLTMEQDIFAQVVPQNQSFDKQYAGIFHFRFWQYGDWVDVVVDDRLPTKNGELVFVRSDEKNEFWSALLQKAYAKLNGSYEALDSGYTREAFEDFTGGISEVYDLKNLKKSPADLYQFIQKALKAESLLGCSIYNTNPFNKNTTTTTSRQLVTGHAYSVTGAEEVVYRGCKEKLIRIRNPWGKVEWTGPWNDEAPEWSEIDDKVRADLHNNRNDGEFWMAFSDFLSECSELQICNLSPDTITNSGQRYWEVNLFHGSWTRGSTAGGCQNHQDMFWTNPQFRIKLEKPDDDGSNPCCTVIVGLMQKNRRRQKKYGDYLLNIGYSVYRIENHTKAHLDRQFFMSHQPVATSGSFTNMREVSARFELPVGEYLIVPSTFEPFKAGDFCLRVFSEKAFKTLEVGDVVQAKPYEPKVTEKDLTPDIKNIFDKLAGQNKDLNANELQIILNKLLAKRLTYKGFSLMTCREMISLLDMDGTGTLSLMEFNMLWMKIQKYMEIYLRADTDYSGTMDANEMRTALQDAGFNLNNKIQQSIAQRYASSDLTIDFDSFISCMIRLETFFKIFHLLETKKTGKIKLTLPEWLCTTLV
ncbi:calpain-8-like isoform 2-T2 [Discoglossus pictus]